MLHEMLLSIYIACVYIVVSYAFDEFVSDAVLKVGKTSLRTPLEIDFSFKIWININSSYELWLNLPGFSKLDYSNGMLDAEMMSSIFGSPSNLYSFEWVNYPLFYFFINV